MTTMTQRDWKRVLSKVLADLKTEQARVAAELKCPKAVARRQAEAMACSGGRHSSFNDDLFPGSFRHVTPQLEAAARGAR